MFKKEGEFEEFLFYGEFENFIHYNKSEYNIVFKLGYIKKKVSIKIIKGSII